MCVYRFADAGKTKETKEEANVIASEHVLILNETGERSYCY